MRPILALALALTLSCAARHSTTAFRVLPARPDYLLRSPDSKEVPFPEVFSRYTKTGLDWVDLCPQIELRVENAYFREGAPKHGLANFLGTEIARYRVLPTGTLERVSVESRVHQPPADQPAVQQLLSEPQQRRHHHRFFYQVLLNKKSNVRSAVLLGADSTDELDRMTNQLERARICLRRCFLSVHNLSGSLHGIAGNCSPGEWCPSNSFVGQYTGRLFRESSACRPVSPLSERTRSG